MTREHKLHDTCIDISAPGDMPGFAWTCGPDCREEAPSGPPSATETAQTGTAGGNGWAETQNGAERFTVEAISPYGPYGGVADISLRHDCVTWAVHIDRPITLAELNRRAAEHAEVCR